MRTSERDRARRRSRAARLLAAAALVGMCAAPAAVADEIPESVLPSTMHGAAETQAITVGQGALSLLLDPGTAYAYSTLDRDDYGGGSVNYAMTARGANVNLGTIAYAVLWAPPGCKPRQENVPCVLSGGYHEEAPNTGMHEAKGFPGYAEALYPPPPDSGGRAQDRVYKCVVNKDGPGSPPTGGEASEICRQSDAIPLSAWAETIAPEYRSTGFSRAAGFDVGVLKVAGSESFSEVRALASGKLRSEARSMVHGISFLGGLVSIDSVYSEAIVVGNHEKVDQASATCRIGQIKVGNQKFGTDGGELSSPQLRQALDRIAQDTKYDIDIIPPTGPKVEVVEGVKQVAECAGLRITFADLRDQVAPLCSPNGQCAPALGLREELSFGRIAVQQSVNDQPDLGGGLDGLDGLDVVGGGDFGAGTATGNGTGGYDAGAGPVGELGGGSGIGSGGGAGSEGGAGTGTRGGGGSRGGGGIFENASSTGPNVGLLGGLAAGASLALLLGFLLVIGVVDALATGRPFHFPGV